MIDITLTWAQVRMAAVVGVNRHIESKARGLKDNHGYIGDANWQYDLDGACAELAVANFLGLHWNGKLYTFKNSDVGKDLQIRHTTKRTNRLIIRNDDTPTHKFVLVLGGAPTFTLAGWIFGGEAFTHKEWLDAPNGREAAFFVPQSALHDPELLR